MPICTVTINNPAIVLDKRFQEVDFIARGLALASQAKHIVCSHLYRDIDALQLQALARQGGYEGIMSVGRDLMIFIL